MSIDDFGRSLAEIIPGSKLAPITLFLFFFLSTAGGDIPEFQAVVDLWLPYLLNGCFAVMGWYLLSSFLRIYYPKQDYENPTAMGVMAKPSDTMRTEAIIWQGSVHEAGHLITLKLLPKELLPDYLHVVIKDKLSQLNGSGGYVRYSFESGEEPKESGFNYWLLCCYRAGAIAESLVLEKDYTLSGDDFRKWEVEARTHLLHSNKYHYFAIANSESEAIINATSLEKLRDDIDSDVKKLLSENVGLITDIAMALHQKKRLEREEILTFLQHGN